MGRISVDNPNNPASAMISLNSFRYFAGKPDCSLLKTCIEKDLILVPHNDMWEDMICAVLPDAKKNVRYAVHCDQGFDANKLALFIHELPCGFQIQKIDKTLYYQCLQNDFFKDFVSNFKNADHFLQTGLGYVITKKGTIVSGASSFCCYPGGIEIEVDTDLFYRRRHLAEAACSALIMECLSRCIYPNWDAMNTASLALSKKLGYQFTKEYAVYITKERVH